VPLLLLCVLHLQTQKPERELRATYLCASLFAPKQVLDRESKVCGMVVSFA
jgi:hypothetical protein